MADSSLLVQMSSLVRETEVAVGLDVFYLGVWVCVLVCVCLYVKGGSCVILICVNWFVCLYIFV